MINAYLFCYADDFGTQEVVVAWLDHRAEILNWVTTPMRNTIVIVAEDDAPKLAALVRSAFPEKNFLLAPVDQYNADGHVPKAIWDHIINPQCSEDWYRRHDAPF